jgi:sulfate transport system permease protein
MAGFRFREPSIIPGFRLTFGFTIFYLSLIVLIPIVGLYLKTFELDWSRFVPAHRHRGRDSWRR